MTRLFLFCTILLLASCNFSSNIPDRKRPADCRHWTDMENFGFHGAIEDFGITEGKAIKRDKKWYLDSNYSIWSHGSYIAYGNLGFTQYTNGRDWPIEETHTQIINGDTMLWVGCTVDSKDKTLLLTDTLRWLDTFHAIRTYYDYEDTMSVNKLSKVARYTLDRQCVVTNYELDEYDLSTDKLKSHKTLEIKPGAQNQYLNAVDFLDPKTITILKRDHHGNPVKLLRHCKECETPCLILLNFKYSGEQ